MAWPLSSALAGSSVAAFVAGSVPEIVTVAFGNTPPVGSTIVRMSLATGAGFARQRMRDEAATSS